MDSTVRDTLIFADRVYPTPHDDPVGAVLVRRGQIAGLGSREEMTGRATPGAKIHDFIGATVTAGFTDSHVHLTSWALARRNVVLNGAASIEAAVKRVADHKATGEWLLGHGWSRHRWSRLPERSDLDAATRGRPAFLDSQDIHAAWLNSEALRRCGITRDTPDPEGGRIVRDEAGEPTGLLLEEARAYARQFLPGPGMSEVVSALREAQAVAHALGLTGVHSVEAEGLRDFTHLQNAGALKLRVLQHIQLSQLEGAIQVGLSSGFGGDWITIGGVKMFLDGSLGSRTAWMSDPYEGGGDDRGIQTLASRDFEAAVRRAAEHGLASTVHAIGDAAVKLALDVLGTVPPPVTLPHRIEHLQLCPSDLWDRAARSGIVASMQAVHVLTDITPAERNWGTPRTRGAYPLAPLLRAGMTLALGSDVPVETLDPRPGLYGATRRGSWAGYEAGEAISGWYPEHALTGAEAVAGYTLGPALAARQQHRRGALRTGFDADLVVWDRDPVTAAPEEYRDMQCLMTMVAGEIVHMRGG